MRIRRRHGGLRLVHAGAEGFLERPAAVLDVNARRVSGIGDEADFGATTRPFGGRRGALGGAGAEQLAAGGRRA
ncbi:MAG: hypothetical protein M5U26_03235 [Planctomycetota bacterium]|nr:hypothetical protein [Planctomycetota bacterium]